MNFSTYDPSQAPLFLMTVEPMAAANPAVIAAGWQDFFSEEMDRAIGLQEESFAVAQRAQSQMAELLDRDGWLSPAMRNTFELTAQMMQVFVEVQRSWQALLTASASAMTLPLSCAHPLGEYASGTLQLQGCSEEEYAQSMDIAIGEQAA